MSRLRIVCTGGEPGKVVEARKALESIRALLTTEIGVSQCKIGELVDEALEPRRRTYPMINGMVSSFCDVFATIVDDDGKESVPITNITSIAWRAAQGSEPTTATLEFFDVDVELEVRDSDVMRLDVGRVARAARRLAAAVEARRVSLERHPCTGENDTEAGRADWAVCTTEYEAAIADVVDSTLNAEVRK